jgi:hypothetical protein
MALAAGLFPSEKTPPPSQIALFIAKIGRVFAEWLMFPFTSLHKVLPGMDLAGMAYVYIFGLGFIIGTGIFIIRMGIITRKQK